MLRSASMIALEDNARRTAWRSRACIAGFDEAVTVDMATTVKGRWAAKRTASSAALMWMKGNDVDNCRNTVKLF